MKTVVPSHTLVELNLPSKLLSPTQRHNNILLALIFSYDMVVYRHLRVPPSFVLIYHMQIITKYHKIIIREVILQSRWRLRELQNITITIFARPELVTIYHLSKYTLDPSDIDITSSVVLPNNNYLGMEGVLFLCSPFCVICGYCSFFIKATYLKVPFHNLL